MKHAFLLLVFAATTLGAYAQPDTPLREKKEKVDAMKAAYITRQLDLSAEEAQVFWPVYNELDKKIDELRIATAEKMMAIRKSGKKIEDMSEAELKALMQERLDNDEKIAQLKKAYHEKFIKILGVHKTAKLYMAELDFARQLMRRARQGAPGDDMPPPPH